MDILKIGMIIGQIEGTIRKIDCGTLSTPKNERNSDAKELLFELVNNLKSELRK